MPTTTHRRPHRLTPDERAALVTQFGQANDVALARQFHIMPSNVRLYRLKHGIPSPPSGALQQALLDMLRTNGPLTARALAEWRGCSRQCVYEALETLEARGYVRRTGETPARWVVVERRKEASCL